MTRHARAERAALCRTLLEVGPDRPTLCAGWTTRALAAHLVVRERRPDAQAGMWLPRFAGHTLAVQRQLVDGAQVAWPDLVRMVRTGPPWWHPARLGPVDEALNTAEFFVHHEDVRRADAGAPRSLDPDLQRALWRACGTAGRLALRGAPVGVRLVAPGFGAVTARRGAPSVTVTGEPAELLLFALGRRAVAQVDLRGPDAAVHRLQAARSGF